MTNLEIIKIIQNKDHGKTIEMRIKNNPLSDWTVIENPQWNFADCEYRVKEEPKFRPYNNAEEFLQASKEHGPYLKVKLSYGNNFYIAVNVSDQGVVLYKCDPRWNRPEQHNEQIDFDNVKLCYVWQDGTPCEILE